ncbi:MAG: hypothetical protein IIB17_02425 [Chloroflexi bacterium]|nr:hypothetical protein [Chloroflexota bacterium]
MKNPAIAATMNIIPLGFGYLYLKEYSRFALTFFGGVTSTFSAVALIAILSIGLCVWDGCTDTERAITYAPAALPVMLSLFTMFDASRRGGRAKRRR